MGGKRCTLSGEMLMMYPIAMAVVEAELKDSWGWFLDILTDVIGKPADKGWIFISDRQKGLTESMDLLFPGVEHRFCIRHKYSNYQKLFKGKELKDLMWGAASAYTVPEFEAKMRALKAMSKEAHDWLLREPIEHWAICKYSPRAQTGRMVNNISESFNNVIKEVRDKPILTMLEGLRRYVMQRYVEKTKFCDKFSSRICPNICKKLEFIKEWAADYSVIYASPQKFEVSSPLMSFIVDLGIKTCTCRKWDVTGIPCTHACAAMMKDRVRPEDYISYYYHTETFKAWLRTEYEDIMPPPYRRKTGRPRKSRRRGEDETTNPNRSKRDWSRKKPEMTRCSRCKTIGHNVRTCKAIVSTQFEEGESSQPRRATSARGRGNASQVSASAKGKSSQVILGKHFGKTSETSLILGKPVRPH